MSSIWALPSLFGSRMILGGLACMLHGLLPFLFTSTGRRTIELLHDRMVINRRRHSDPPPGLKETAG